MAGHGHLAEASTALRHDTAPPPTFTAASGEPLTLTVTRIDVSVVVPVKDEADNVIPLLQEIHAAVTGQGAFEIIFIDDCSKDGTRDVLSKARETVPELRILLHDVNCGQSSAIRTGVLAARGRVIVTLDGDGQNDPADIPSLLAKLNAPDAPPRLAMISGQRQKRQDSAMKRLASKLANDIRGRLLNDKTRDAGCGLKAFEREAFLRLPYFDHMHRFMTALMLREGYEVDFVPVRHRARRFGKSKYGVLDRLWVSLSDILGVMWLARRCRLPRNLSEIE